MHSDVYLAAQSSAVGTITYKEEGPKRVVLDPSSGSSSAISTANRAAVGAVGSCCRLFAYATHTDVYLAVQKLRCRLPAFVTYQVQKMSRNA